MLISVIVPTYNSEAVVGEAIRSLAEQSFRDFEVILSDGASSDQTVRMVEGLAASLPHLVVDSRPDTGVYDAINRGVRLSRGTWLLVLGSDDRLHSTSTLHQIAAFLHDAGPAKLVYGDVRMMGVNLCGVPPGGRYAGPLPITRMIETNICQQAIFYRRSLFDEMGGFDERYKLYADWDFNLRATFAGVTKWVDVVVSDYAATGMSAGGVDTLFMADMPELICRQLVQRPGQRELWPLQRRVRSLANKLRKRGLWRPALAWLCSYVYLLLRRIPMLIRA